MISIQILQFISIYEQAAVETEKVCSEIKEKQNLTIYISVNEASFQKLKEVLIYTIILNDLIITPEDKTDCIFQIRQKTTFRII